MRKIVFIITLLYLTLTSLSAQPEVTKHEMRAVWLTTIGGVDWPRTRATNATTIKAQQDELCRILDQLQAANVNAVMLQARIRASVIYPSNIEPWDYVMSGKAGVSPGYDPLQFAIDECHKRGMQLHAWVVTIPVGKWNSAATKQIRQRMPNNIRKIGDEGYMNPERPETADYIAGICREITKRYDIDGIHLDYIRYPETWKITVPHNEGRQHITRIVRTIHDAVKSIKPWIMFSCSPIGKFDDLTRYSSRGWNAYSKVCQDAQGWLRDDLMDALFPMMYFKGEHFYPFAVDWHQHTSGRIIAAGLGTYMLDRSQQNWSLDIMKREMYVLRDLGLGHAHFRSKFLTDDTKGIYDFTVKEFDRYPALVPPMTWAHSQLPDAPESLTVSQTVGGTRLDWTAVAANESYILYNVYAAEQTPVDTDDPRNLIATRLMGTSLQDVGGNADMHYAVTAIDRYGNESTPRQDVVTATPAAALPTITGLIENDGKTLIIPDGYENVEYLVIETTLGIVVAQYDYTNQIDISSSSFPPNYYILKGVNEQGTVFRIGAFKKE